MCGRYVSVQADADLLAEFEAVDATDEVPAGAGFNVAPTEQIRAIVNRKQRGADGQATGEPVRQLRVMAWGLVPSWSEDRKGAGKLINARSESLARSPAFRRAFASRRCLVPADGWYEWKHGDGPRAAKQPFYMTPVDGHGLAFAGLYEFWSPPDDPDAATITTCTIVTTEAVGELAEIHNRMPLVLPRATWGRWLDPGERNPTDLLRSWDEASGEHLELRPVSTLVNAVTVDKKKNDDPAMIERVPLTPEAQALF